MVRLSSQQQSDESIERKAISSAALAALKTPLAAALGYAAQGWAVLPTAGIVSGRCGCRLASGCANHVGKHPLNRGGVSEPTTDPAVIRGWWDRWPWAGVGIVTGPASGLLVVDVDLKQDGPGTIRRLASEGLDLTQTLTVTTGSGGRHYLFAAPEGRWLPSTVGNIPGVGSTPGIDLRGAGTYVVAAPSPHQSGRRYEWVKGSPDLAPLPSSLLERLPASPPQATPSASVELPTLPRTQGTSPYGEAALAAEVGRVQSAREERNATLFHASRRLGQLVGGGELSGDVVAEHLRAAALSAGLSEGETDRTIRSGLATGVKTPRRPSASKAGRPSTPGRQRKGYDGPTRSPSCTAPRSELGR